MKAALGLMCLLAGLPVQASSASGCPSPAPADMLVSKQPLAMPVRPAHCETVNQTPPDFSWPDQGGASGYEVELTGPLQGRKKSLRNWINWGTALPPGEYQWRVTRLNRQGTAGQTSAWRRFVIAADAVPFVVPDGPVLLETAAQRARPRAFFRGAALAAWQKAIGSQRQPAWAGMLKQLAVPLPDEDAATRLDKPSKDGGARRYATQLTATKQAAAKVSARLLQASLAWMGTGDPAYREEARRLLGVVAGWDPQGATGAAHHQTAGQLVWAMALAYDWLHPHLSAPEKQRTRDAIAGRMDALLATFKQLDAHRLEKNPYNSHGWVALGEMAAASALLVGDDPRARVWFNATVPAFIQSVSPWGWHAGGMGNGTAYGMWDLMALMPPMDILREVLGVNLYQKASIRNLARFNAYFMPPGGVGGLFGDGAEKMEHAYTDDYLHAFALRVSEPWARWAAAGRAPGQPEAFIQLFAPAGDVPADAMPPQDSASGMLAASTGWVAMHSTLRSPRASVYFHAGPYGSFNHSHASQNGFVVELNGKRVLIDSGYYDYYGSPHHSGWYQRTVAHNAITFDGGQGQTTSDMNASGTVVFHSTGALADTVRGDATAAYGGQLSRALRTLVFVRPATLVVVDRLESSKARNWEWNVHADEAFRDNGKGRVVFSTPQGDGCLEVVSTSTPVTFTQTNVFTVPPESRRSDTERFPPQWHGAFKTLRPSNELVMATAIHLDCASRLPVAFSGSGAAVTITVDGKSWRFDADGKPVQMPEGTP